MQDRQRAAVRFAAMPGTVRIIPNDLSLEANANHCMGNIIIIEHGNRVHTLYAHLDEIEPSLVDGQHVAAGTRIGTYGNRGQRGPRVDKSGDRVCTPFGTHLHFEVKQWSTIGNLSDHEGPEYGYIRKAYPSVAGLVDPLSYFLPDFKDIEPTVVQVMDNVASIRSGVTFEQRSAIVGPSAAVGQEAILETARAGQRFVAFARYREWYQIYFPNNNGPAAGWIRARETTGNVLGVDDRFERIQGVNVRTAPSTEGTRIVAKVWDGQLLVQHGARARNTDTNGACRSEWWYEPGFPG